ASVILLTSAALLVRSIRYQSTFDPGFAFTDVAVVSFELPVGTYDAAKTGAFVGDISSALQGVTGIDAFGFASQEPFALSRNVTAFRRVGETSQQNRPITYLDVSPGYLNALRIPVVAGRALEAADERRPVVLINEAMAREYWP